MLGGAAFPVWAKDADSVLLLSYFTDKDEGRDGLKLARSDDGYRFTPLGGGRPDFLRAPRSFAERLDDRHRLEIIDEPLGPEHGQCIGCRGRSLRENRRRERQGYRNGLANRSAFDHPFSPI
ncbi:hypothetical protein [Sphingomonas sp. SAFR-052]|uniref:hypothetical protein n=1 Tax=Sphingomonas sp. SAFR-052 TaxID=3436867 RepID=UPI003F81184A